DSFSAFASDEYGSMVIKDENSQAKLIDKCVDIYGYQLSVASSIVVHYYIKIPDEIYNDDEFMISFSGTGINTQSFSTAAGELDGSTVSDWNYTPDGTYYRFDVEVPAACMTSEITTTISFTNNEVVMGETFSVKKYADQLSLINEKLNLGYNADELSGFVTALLNYGAAAQTYFGVNTTNLANAGLSTTVPENTNTSTATYKEDPVGSLSFYKATLVCNADTTLKYYFLLPSAEANLSDYTIKINDEVVPVSDIKINQNPNYFTISIPVTAKNYETKYNVTVSYQGGAFESVCSYSVSDCVASICNSTENADLKNLLYALHAYGTAAQAINVGN
ncbi:MAG: hypothetical protein J5883_06375, partial [Clostridiales bacterium]|nr:hypothetical protein [Clostridiales bacterium]